MQRDRHAFSLIELIVTISIISILIAILLPALPKVRDAAQRAACGAHLRSVGQAVELYKGEFREVFPVARYMPRPWLSADTDPSLNKALSGQFEADSKAWKCPGDREVHEQTYIDDEGQTQISGVSYAYVAGFSGQRFEETFFARRLEYPPSEAPIVYDFDNGTFELESGDTITVDFFHSSRNLLFVDGHVGSAD